MRLEKNAGMYGVTINPSQNIFNSNKWDIHLGSAGLFVQNNYLYFKETHLWKLFRNRRNLIVVDDKVSVKDNVVEVGYVDNEASRFLQARAFVTGPAIGFQFKKNQTIGCFVQLRSGLSATKIPNEFTYNKITKRKHFDPFRASEFGGAVMNWLELGANYAYLKMDNNKNAIGIGANIKYIIGYDMAYGNSRRSYQHVVTGENDFQMERPHIAFGFSSMNDIGTSVHGKGAGIDFGVSYTKNMKNDDFDYKAGVSLIDLGFVRFSRDIRTYDFISDSTISILGRDYQNLSFEDGLQGLSDVFIQNSIGQKQVLTTGDKKTILLPFSISAQFDYKLKKSVYIHALMIQPVSLSDFRIRGVHLISLTPRYETKWYSVSLPVSLIEKRIFNIGLAARLGILTLGSDNIVSILRKSNFYGSDIFAGIKFGLGNKAAKKTFKSNIDDCFRF
ncbi:MAG: hypothetical protein IPK35_07700 [Saprospiraceae bacterium]|nr:hypothetical protein [Saprospiraceae bacterium]